MTGSSEQNPKSVTFETNFEDQQDVEIPDQTKADTSSRFFRWNAIFGLSFGNPFSHKSLVCKERENSFDDTDSSSEISSLSSNTTLDSEFDRDDSDEESRLLDGSVL